jgi:phage baseplate assembly protein W
MTIGSGTIGGGTIGGGPTSPGSVQLPVVQPLVPHFSLPFRFAGGRAVTVEQDSLDDVEGCVEAVLRYTRGSRPEAPDFGIPDQAFTEHGAQIGEIAAAVEDAEPRAAVLLARAEDELARATSLEDGIDIVRVTVGQLARQGDQLA